MTGGGQVFQPAGKRSGVTVKGTQEEEEKEEEEESVEGGPAGF